MLQNFCIISYHSFILFFFFFNDTATTEIYTLSLHDALPICLRGRAMQEAVPQGAGAMAAILGLDDEDRKSTRLNSSHLVISYAVFCLKKKKKRIISTNTNATTFVEKHVTESQLC